MNAALERAGHVARVTWGWLVTVPPVFLVAASQVVLGGASDIPEDMDEVSLEDTGVGGGAR